MQAVSRATPVPGWRRLGAVLERDRNLGPLLLAPAIIYIVVLVGFPFVMAFFFSLSDVTIGKQSLQSLHFVGLKNYLAILKNPTFLRALKNTFVFTFASQALVLVLAKILALALYQDFRGKTIVRALLLLPWVAPVSLGAIGWLWILDSLYSVVNWTLRAIGILAPHSFGPYWLGEPGLAMISVILVHTWRMLPFATVIILAGLSSLPKEVLDAAAVDGANFWTRLFYVVIPMMLPIMSIAVLFGIVFTFTDMAVVYVLTRGGPVDSTHVLASFAFFKGIQGGDLAQGAAIALFLFPVLAGVAALILRMARRIEVAA